MLRGATRVHMAGPAAPGRSRPGSGGRRRSPLDDLAGRALLGMAGVGGHPQGGLGPAGVARRPQQLADVVGGPRRPLGVVVAMADRNAPVADSASPWRAR